jgi:hypothetical protein
MGLERSLSLHCFLQLEGCWNGLKILQAGDYVQIIQLSLEWIPKRLEIVSIIPPGCLTKEISDEGLRALLALQSTKCISFAFLVFKIQILFQQSITEQGAKLIYGLEGGWCRYGFWGGFG